jgi:hypothetical protein
MTMLMRKLWQINLDVPATGTLTERILAGRGLQDPTLAAAFLAPSIDNRPGHKPVNHHLR